MRTSSWAEWWRGVSDEDLGLSALVLGEIRKVVEAIHRKVQVAAPHGLPRSLRSLAMTG